MFSLINKKIESYSIRDFLAGSHKLEYNSQTPLYGFMGINITGHSLFSNFNMPYFIVIGTTGIILFSTLIEHILILNGHGHMADRLNNFMKLMFPICFYSFLIYGIITVF